MAKKSAKSASGAKRSTRTSKSVKRRTPKQRASARRRSSTAPSLRFLKSAHRAVRKHLSASTDLPTFLEGAGTLNLNGRKRLVEQALVLMRDNFVHLPLKEAMHGVDPVQRLRLIQHRLEQGGGDDSEFAFHRQMVEVFTSVRDLHTNYLLPEPFADKVAFLPFDIEEYFEDGSAKYIASHFVQGFTHSHFKSGVEITAWNGVPIKRAIEVSADQHAGSNRAARHARGVEGMTLRALRRALPPDETWIIVGYIDLNGVAREMKQDWLVTPLLPDSGGVDPDALGGNAAVQGIDIEADLKHRARTMLYAPGVLAERPKNRKLIKRAAGSGEAVDTTMAGIFSARNVVTSLGEFGYIRIFSFNVDDPDAFIDEFIRLAGLLRQNGLIIDVRGNGGGHIFASEGLLQVLTPGEIDPEPTQFITTALNGRICERHAQNPVGIDLGPWTESIRSSVETGAIYSAGIPITPYEFANSRGQHYHGPALLITDARCYSATDIFAAGFQDHSIGPVLGVDGNTGAGGANVWTHGLLRELLRQPAPVDAESPYESLPNGAGMRVAIRRTLRIREQAGTPLEDIGVVPDLRHAMTKSDLLNGNQDLIEAAAQVLSEMPVRALSATVSQAGTSLSVQANTAGIDRLDVYADNRPLASLDVVDGAHSLAIDVPSSTGLLELAGYQNGEYVAARRLAL